MRAQPTKPPPQSIEASGARGDAVGIPEAGGRSPREGGRDGRDVLEGRGGPAASAGGVVGGHRGPGDGGGAGEVVRVEVAADAEPVGRQCGVRRGDVPRIDFLRGVSIAARDVDNRSGGAGARRLMCQSMGNVLFNFLFLIVTRISFQHFEWLGSNVGN